MTQPDLPISRSTDLPISRSTDLPIGADESSLKTSRTFIYTTFAVICGMAAFYVLSLYRDGKNDEAATGYFSNAIDEKKIAATSPQALNDVRPWKEATDREKDFGFVAAGETVSHNFELLNTTDQIWEIAELATSCSCTVASITQTIIPPGDIAVVVARYVANSASYRDRQNIRVLFRDRTQVPVDLTILATVREPIHVEPTLVGFQEVGRGETRQVVLMVENFTQDSWENVSVSSSAAWLTATAHDVYQQDESTTEPRQTWRVTVNIDSSGLVPGDHHASIDLRGGDLSKTVAMPIRVSSPVIAIPSQFFFNRNLNSEGQQRTVLIRFAKGMVPKTLEDIEIVVVPASEMLKVEWGERKGSDWELIAKAASEYKSESGEASTVIVTFKSQTLPRIVLPVYLFRSDHDSSDEVN